MVDRAAKKKSDQGNKFRGRLTPAHAGRYDHYSRLLTAFQPRNFLQLIPADRPAVIAIQGPARCVAKCRSLLRHFPAAARPRRPPEIRP